MAYRFVQEAMTNAFRHAGATRIEVSLRFETPVDDAKPARSGAGGLVVRVADDGRGLQGEPAAGHGARRHARPGPDAWAAGLSWGLAPEGGVVVEARFGTPRRSAIGKISRRIQEQSARKTSNQLKCLAARPARLSLTGRGRRSETLRVSFSPGEPVSRLLRWTKRRSRTEGEAWRDQSALALRLARRRSRRRCDDRRARADTVVLPTFDVVATTPLGGGEIDVAKSPGSVWQTGAQDIQTFNDTTVPDTLARQAPGVTVNNVSGNDFQPDVSYRGFDATAGHRNADRPRRLSERRAHQRGLRRHGQLGPHSRERDRQDDDRRRRTRSSASTRSAARVTVTMKNGFTWQGFEADLRGGSFYRAQEEFQYGKQVGDWSVYLAGTQINDGGWRVDSASQLTNFYGDVGYRANGFESHLQLTAADTQFGAAVFAPIQELQNNWSSVYTVPQTTYNKMAMLAWTGSYAYSNTLSFQGGAYFRAFNQAHVDGNPTDVTPCPPFSCLNGSPVHDTFGESFPISRRTARQSISARSTETGRSRARSASARRPSTPTRFTATTIR